MTDLLLPSAKPASSSEPIHDDLPALVPNTKEDFPIQTDKSETQSVIQKRFRDEILIKHVYPNNIETLDMLFTDKKFYTKLLLVVHFLITIFSALVVPAFLLSDVQFPGHYLNYIGTICSLCVAVFIKAEAMIIDNNKKRKDKTNAILKSMGIKYEITDSMEDVSLPQQSLSNGLKSNTAAVAIPPH